jgi:tetratricopeptide (TPR) repeat protein
LQHAKCLRQLARYEMAVNETRKVLEAPEKNSLNRANALYEMSQLSGLGTTTQVQPAIKLLTKSIEIADRLAIDSDAKVSQQAKQLLVEAHLAMAVEIAKGQWAQEDQTVPQWIERASALSEEMIAHDASDLPLRLQVAVSALAAAASLETPIDPLLWIEEAEETVQLLRSSARDRETRSQYDWQLGLAYFHGAQVQHRRSEPESAERLAKLAVTKLNDLAKQRDELPNTAYLMGRLYFQIGAIHAVHHKNHQVACQWYDRAIDYLLNPVPVTTIAAPQQHGDALVSMGVSYWRVKRRDDAIEATQSGVELIEHAVSSGLLQADSLAVPYENLAAMYEARGETEQATRYTRLAENLTDSKVSSKPVPQKRS